MFICVVLYLWCVFVFYIWIYIYMYLCVNFIKNNLLLKYFKMIFKVNKIKGYIFVDLNEIK